MDPLIDQSGFGCFYVKFHPGQILEFTLHQAMKVNKDPKYLRVQFHSSCF
jgi:hypothetical protein